MIAQHNPPGRRSWPGHSTVHFAVPLYVWLDDCQMAVGEGTGPKTEAGCCQRQVRIHQSPSQPRQGAPGSCTHLPTLPARV
jgi:hypothetical protein